MYDTISDVTIKMDFLHQFGLGIGVDFSQISFYGCDVDYIRTSTSSTSIANLEIVGKEIISEEKELVGFSASSTLVVKESVDSSKNKNDMADTPSELNLITNDSSLVVTNDTTSIPALSPLLHGFWAEHKLFYEFILITNSKFSGTQEDVVEFNLSTVGDSTLSKGNYVISDSYLQRFSRTTGKWYIVREFTDDEYEDLPEFHFKLSYFNLV